MNLTTEKEPLIQFLKKPSKKGQVGIVGDLALDRFIFGSVERVSPEAPVLVLKKEKDFDKLGCAANVIANVSTFSHQWPLQIHCFGVMGSDSTSLQIIQMLKDLGPDLKIHFVESAERTSPLKTRFLAGSQHQLLRVDDEEVKDLSNEDQDLLFESIEKQLDQLDVLIVQDYAKGTCPQSLLKRIFEAARKKGVYTVVDPNRNTPVEWYSSASLLTPNVDEAESLTRMKLNKGKDDNVVSEACQKVREHLKLDEMILTRGGHGMTVLDQNNNFHHLPALARSVFDVTGAGDTVVSMLAAAKSCGADTVTAAHLANLAASIVVSKVGTACVSIDEILTLLDSPKS